MINESKTKTDMVLSNVSLSNIKIGERIECMGYFGTVKYIGSVDTYPSIWLGIDWDDESRGKHNGTVNGIQYFETRFPKSGSFVRPEKVQFGHSVVESIISRYGHKEDEITAQKLQQYLLNIQQSMNAPFLEMVGFEKVFSKQSHFNDLRVVNLRLQNIRSAGESGQLIELCPNIQELDLSKNLITSWKTVFEICDQLKQLRWLSLSENILNMQEKNDEDKSFESVEILVCSAMHLNWQNMLQISRSFPKLIEFRAPCNDLKNLDTPAGYFQSLKILDIEDTPIENWSEICKLSVITNLEELIIGNIGLRKITFDGNSNKVDTFPNLKKLSISHNNIDNWESFNELNRLQALEDLRCVKNPILETENEATRFQIIVARIANLKVFNGSEIKAESRRGAEYDYIKLYGLEWLKVKNTEEKNAFLKLHNRYQELIEKHGSVEEAELIVKSNTIKSNLINLKIIYGEQIVSKKLPQTFLVQRLHMLVQKLFKLNERPTLVYSSADSKIRINLDDQQKEIGFYSIQEGDRILVYKDDT